MGFCMCGARPPLHQVVGRWGAEPRCLGCSWHDWIACWKLEVTFQPLGLAGLCFIPSASPTASPPRRLAASGTVGPCSPGLSAAQAASSTGLPGWRDLEARCLQSSSGLSGGPFTEEPCYSQRETDRTPSVEKNNKSPGKFSLGTERGQEDKMTQWK